MTLPTVPLETATVQVAGQDVTIRSLSRAEVIELASLEDRPGEAEEFVLSAACGISRDEAAAWRRMTDARTAGQLLREIRSLSALGGARPSSEASNGA